MTQHDFGFIILSLFVIGTSFTLGFPPGGLTGKPHPFGDCVIYQLGNDVTETETQELRDGSQLAFFPMKNDEVMLYFEIHIDETVFRVSLTGTTFKLEKCSLTKRGCTVEDEGGVKHNDFIRPLEWNIVKVMLSSQQLKIYVGPRMVKTMSMADFAHLGNLSWLVKDKLSSNDGSPAKGSVKGGRKYPNEVLYLVQFRCKEFVPHDNAVRYTTPTYKELITKYDGSWKSNSNPNEILEFSAQDFSGDEKDIFNLFNEHFGKAEASKMSKGSYIGLVVGLVFLALIIIAIALAVFYFLKKKRSAAITEQSPLHDQKAATK